MRVPGPDAGPTVRRILLGAQLRRLRQARYLTRDAAGEAIRGTGSKISRMELGRVKFKPRDVADLLNLYGVSEAGEREAVLGLARKANQPGWWQSYSDLMPGWLASYVDLEQSASRIRTYEVQFIPGLLQTVGYAYAVTAAGFPTAGAEEIERRVQLRMERTQLLLRPDPPRLWAVIDEAALRRPIGTPPVMRTQLKHLLEVAKLPYVHLQVMPFSRGAHPAETGAFTLLRFPYDDLSDVVYLEQLTRAFYLDDRTEVEVYTEAMDQLCARAATPADSADIIAQLIAETRA